MAKPNGLRALMVGGNPVVYYPPLARALKGSVSAAIFIGRIAHWEQYSEDGWVYRTAQQIEEETALTRRPQESARKVLRDLGVIEEELRNVPATLHWRIKWEELEEVYHNPPNQFVQNGQTGMDESAKLDSPKAPNKNDQNGQTINSGNNGGEDGIPPGGEAPQADAPPEEPDEDKTTARDFVAFIYEELEGVTPPILRNRRGRLGQNFKEYLEAGTDEMVLWKAAQWLVARWRGQYGDHVKLTVEAAVEDVVNNKAFSGPEGGYKKANQGSGESNVSPITPGDGQATPPAGIAVLEADSELKRYAQYAYKYDFSVDGERPPYRIFANLGGDEDEQDRNLTRIRSKVKRAVRDAQDTDELKSAMHYIVSYGLDAGDVQVIYHQTKAEDWTHAEMAEELERRAKRHG